MQQGDTDFIGAVKIKDGLFMGDGYAAQDLELLITNKVTHIINCSGREMPNHWEAVGVVYLTLPWQESDYQTLFEGRSDIMTSIYKFIETVLNKGESVLVHSLKGINRCCCVIAAYCMKKYRWTLYKTLEFIQSRKPNVSIRPNFLSQLMSLENKLARLGFAAKTYNWSEIGDNPKNLESDELLVTNTFLNSKPNPPADYQNLNLKEYKTSKIVWIDQQAQPSENKPSVASVISLKKKDKKGERSLRNSVEGKEPTFVKSILKGSGKVFYLENQTKEKPNEQKNDLASFGAGPMTPGRKLVGKLRPGSSMIQNGRSQLLKSSSTSGLDKVGDDHHGQGMQGNIIHITVNNFINAEGPSSTKSASNRGEIKFNKDKKGGLSMSASSKDLSTILSKSSVLPSSSMLYDKNSYDNNSMVVAQNLKVNNFIKDPSAHSNVGSLAIYGLGQSRDDYSGEKGSTSLRKIGIPAKGFKLLEDSKLTPTEKSASMYSSAGGTTKYTASGKPVPIRVLGDIDVSRNPANFIPKKKSSRPTTAPNNPNRNIVDSPYYHPDNYHVRQTRESKTMVQTSSSKRSGSLQSNKEPKTVVIKSRVRNPSPGDSSYRTADNFFSAGYKTKLFL